MQAPARSSELSVCEQEASRTRGLDLLTGGRELAGFAVDPEHDDSVGLDIRGVEQRPLAIETEVSRQLSPRVFPTEDLQHSGLLVHGIDHYAVVPAVGGI